MTKEQFRCLVEEQERLIFTICYQLVQDYHEAQNLTQETFVSAFAHIDTVEEKNLRAWLARIATNKAKDSLKTAYHRRVSPAGGINELDILRSEESPERLYICGEQEQVIRQIIHQLSEPYHKVSVLFFLEEKTVEEIAEQLTRPKKTVQTQLYRARQMLQERLKEEVT